MPVIIRIPTSLRKMTNGFETVESRGATVEDLLADLERQFPGFKSRLCDESGRLKRFVNCFLNNEDIRFLDGIRTQVKEGDEISIVPAIAGGAQAK